MKYLLAVTLLATVVSAQQPSFGVHLLKSEHKVDWSPAAQAQADKDYESACSVFERETKLKTHPQFVLVLGNEIDQVFASEDGKSEVFEIRLKKWDEVKFIEGVLRLAAHQVLSKNKLTEMVRTTHAWANASIDVSDLQKQK